MRYLLTALGLIVLLIFFSSRSSPSPVLRNEAAPLESGSSFLRSAGDMFADFATLIHGLTEWQWTLFGGRARTWLGVRDALLLGLLIRGIYAQRTVRRFKRKILQ